MDEKERLRDNASRYIRLAKLLENRADAARAVEIATELELRALKIEADERAQKKQEIPDRS